LPGVIELNQAFNRAALLSGNRATVVHIASHFAFNPADNSLSFLVLGDGERLDMGDFRNLPDDLFRNVDLLSLAACDTATGSGANRQPDPDANGREVEGLAYEAQEKGAKTVLASLWPIADEGTKELMARFYQLRQARPATPKGELLRQAQLSLLRGNHPAPVLPAGTRGTEILNPKGTPGLPPWPQDKEAPYSHPYYWSPFILIGNWQ
jgi:CHAT domain-containing protein